MANSEEELTDFEQFLERDIGEETVKTPHLGVVKKPSSMQKKGKLPVKKPEPEPEQEEEQEYEEREEYSDEEEAPAPVVRGARTPIPAPASFDEMDPIDDVSKEFEAMPPRPKPKDRSGVTRNMPEQRPEPRQEPRPVPQPRQEPRQVAAPIAKPQEPKMAVVVDNTAQTEQKGDRFAIYMAPSKFGIVDNETQAPMLEVNDVDNLKLAILMEILNRVDKIEQRL